MSGFSDFKQEKTHTHWKQSRERGMYFLSAALFNLNKMEKEILKISIVQCISGFLHKGGEIEIVPNLLKEIANDYQEQIEIHS